MIIPRDTYLQQLIDSRFNSLIKVITGIRRSGKSYLLFKIYRNYLISNGVAVENIVEIALDDIRHENLRDPKKLSRYLHNAIKDPNQQYYIFLDEVQYAITKEEMRNPASPIQLYGVLNGLYILGMLMFMLLVVTQNSFHPIMTEFRGGDIIHIYPLSFAEYHAVAGLETTAAYEEYARFGGMPHLFFLKGDEKKYQYLSNLFSEVYFKDIVERYTIQRPLILSQLTDVLSSSVGSLTNANKLANTISSVTKNKVSSETISTYIEYLIDSFLFKEAKRYDVKGKKYFHYPSKFFCTDIGLRNARLSLDNKMRDISWRISFSMN